MERKKKRYIRSRSQPFMFSVKKLPQCDPDLMRSWKSKKIFQRQRSDVSSWARERDIYNVGEVGFSCWSWEIELHILWGRKLQRNLTIFPPFIRKTVYSFREERYKSQTSQVFTGGGGVWGWGSCFIVHLLERSNSFNLSCGMRQ